MKTKKFKTKAIIALCGIAFTATAFAESQLASAFERTQNSVNILGSVLSVICALIGMYALYKLVSSILRVAETGRSRPGEIPTHGMMAILGLFSPLLLGDISEDSGVEASLNQAHSEEAHTIHSIDDSEAEDSSDPFSI